MDIYEVILTVISIDSMIKLRLDVFRSQIGIVQYRNYNVLEISSHMNRRSLVNIILFTTRRLALKTDAEARRRCSTRGQETLFRLVPTVTTTGTSSRTRGSSINN